MPLVHEDDREATDEAMKSLCAPPHTAYVEQRAMTRGGWRWIAWADTAVLDDEGQVEAVVGVGRDITDRKRAEAALKKTRPSWRTSSRASRTVSVYSTGTYISSTSTA